MSSQSKSAPSFSLVCVLRIYRRGRGRFCTSLSCGLTALRRCGDSVRVSRDKGWLLSPRCSAEIAPPIDTLHGSCNILVELNNYFLRRVGGWSRNSISDMFRFAVSEEYQIFEQCLRKFAGAEMQSGNVQKARPYLDIISLPGALVALFLHNRNQLIFKHGV